MLISVEKILMSVELMRCVTWSIYFLDFLYARYNCAKFHYSRICVTNFRSGVSFWLPYPWVAPKRPIQLKTPVSCEFVYIYWKNSKWKSSFFVQWKFHLKTIWFIRDIKNCLRKSIICTKVTQKLLSPGLDLAGGI